MRLRGWGQIQLQSAEGRAWRIFDSFLETSDYGASARNRELKRRPIAETVITRPRRRRGMMCLIESGEMNRGGKWRQECTIDVRNRRIALNWPGPQAIIALKLACGGKRQDAATSRLDKVDAASRRTNGRLSRNAECKETDEGKSGETPLLH